MPRLLTLLLVLLAPLVVPLCADALTLDATGGNVTLSSASSFEPGVAVFGNGWSLQGFSGSSSPSIFGTMFFHATTLVFHGATFSGQCCDNNSTMTLMWTCPPFIRWASRASNQATLDSP